MWEADKELKIWKIHAGYDEGCDGEFIDNIYYNISKYIIFNQINILFLKRNN